MGITIEYSGAGTLEVAFDDDDEARLRSAKAWLDEVGVTSEWLSETSLPRFEPALAPNARGGLFVAAHRFVGVPSLLAALVQSARIGGAVFESPVEAAEVCATARGKLIAIGAVEAGMFKPKRVFAG